ncbi:MAG: hypothetical protein OSJ27_10405 [Candidatus Gastranaerophilales bacterium]|nr:hypothetical protein [Candidatus Gastranaerophilales bacterium]
MKYNEDDFVPFKLSAFSLRAFNRIVLSVSILLLGFAGIWLALKTAKMIDTVALATKRVDLVCDEIEDALNTHSQYKCDNIVL